MSNIKAGAVAGGFFWRFFERFGAQCVSLIVTIVLARILEPTVYGTIALVTVFTTLLQVFIDSGMGNALIQKKDADELDFSSVFYFNMVVCSLLYLLMFFLAPVIARYYAIPELTQIIRVLSLVLIVSGLRNVQQAYVARNLQFKRFFFSTISGTIVGAVAGIVLAVKGFGVWALVWQTLLINGVSVLCLWFTVGWKPKLLFSFSRLKGLLNYGWKILFSSLVVTVYNNITQLIIGKKYSVVDLGYYNKGKQFPTLIMETTNSSIDSVLLPVLSKEQDNISSVCNITRKSIQLSSFIIWPLMLGFAACAEAFVSVILTDKWLPCVPYLRVFCVIYAIHPIDTANLNAIKALGRSDLYLKLEVIKKILGLILIILSMPYGVMAMSYALLLSAIINLVVNSWPNRTLIAYTLKSQLLDMLPYALLSLIMGGIVYTISLISMPKLLCLAVQIVLGVLIYVIGALLFRFSAFILCLDFIKNKRNK